MAYDEHIVDQVRAANDVVEVISQYVALKRAGHNFKGLCPFHSEKSPSFMVHPEKQIFHCFGCSAGGDVFSFVMRHDNMNFPEALRLLAERARITLPESGSRKEDGPSENEQLYEIYRIAADFYHAQYLDPQKGAAARGYFKARGFSEETAAQFKVGWAMDAWRGLFEFLAKKGFQENLLVKSGLVHRSPKGPIYDAFRKRLLFPIQNLHGKVVAFGGRILEKESDGPKYLNSPENPIFQKRRELFGLHLARRHMDQDKPVIIVVEGYLDYLQLFQAGYRNTVATLGTSLTSEHVHVLKRFAEEAVVVYDGDKAGQAAALRGLEVFLEEDMPVRIAALPAGLDPDDLVRKEGGAAFGAVLSAARDFFDYKLGALRTRFDPKEPQGLLRLSTELTESLSKLRHPVLLDHYVRRLAGALGVDENSIRSELAKVKNKKEERSEVQGRAQTGHPPAAPSERVNADELLLLSLAVDDSGCRSRLFGAFTSADFEPGAAQQVFGRLEAMTREGVEITWPGLLARLENQGVRETLVKSSALEIPSGERGRAFEDCARKIRQRQLDKKLEELRRRITEAEGAGDQVQTRQYVNEYQALWRQKQ